jgi:dienelactone hydrolase
VYDIFGFFPQTLQGADILAYGDKERPYQVFIPDFFDGKPADISWYPPKTEEDGKNLGAFFSGPAAPPKTVPRIPKILEQLKKENPGLTTWGIVGYCWGGKVSSTNCLIGLLVMDLILTVYTDRLSISAFRMALPLRPQAFAIQP